MAIAAEHDVAWVPTDLGLDENALHSTAAPAPRGFSVPQGQGSGVAQAYANEQELPPPPPPGHAPQPNNHNTGNGGGGSGGGQLPAAGPPAPDYHSGYKDGFAAAARAHGNGGQAGGSSGTSSGGVEGGMPVATVVGHPANTYPTGDRDNSSSMCAGAGSGSGGHTVVPVALPFTPSANDEVLKEASSAQPPFRGPTSTSSAGEPEFPPQHFPAVLPQAAPSVLGVAPLPDVTAAPPMLPQVPPAHPSSPPQSALTEEELAALRHLPPAAAGASVPLNGGNEGDLHASNQSAGVTRTASLSLEEMQARLAGLNSTGPDSSSSSSDSSSSSSDSSSSSCIDDGGAGNGDGDDSCGNGGGGIVPGSTSDVPYPAAPGSTGGGDAAPPSDYDSLMSRFESLKN